MCVPTRGRGTGSIFIETLVVVGLGGGGTACTEVSAVNGACGVWDPASGCWLAGCAL